MVRHPVLLDQTPSEASNAFSEALVRNDLETIRQIAKADLHVHGFLGGTRADFETALKRQTPELLRIPEEISDIAIVANAFYRGLQLSDRNLFEACIAATLVRAHRESLCSIDIDVNVRHIAFFDHTPTKLAEAILLLRNTLAPNCEVRLYAGLDSRYDPFEQFDLLSLACAYGDFCGIDLYGGDETAETIDRFRPHFELAHALGLTRKAHFGEFGDAHTLVRGVQELDLHQVQHGVRSIESDLAVALLAKRGTILNICPSMNALLGVSQSFATSKIVDLYRRGVSVTVGTDNALLINCGVSEQFLALYNMTNLDGRDLDSIRRNAFTI